MKEEFIALLDEIGIEINDKDYIKFEKYANTLLEWNKVMNLTAIKEEKDVYIKHFFDSIYLSKYIDVSDIELLDVGSGAGFPSIPLKILFPDLKVTIIDSLNKRIKFLQHLTKELNLEVTLIHGRAEEHNLKNHYDIVTARAVARLNILSELCIPFVKTGGSFIALKGPNYEEELTESKNAIKILGGRVKEVYSYNISDSDRTLIEIEKIEKSKEKYPRQFGKIKAKPL